jgi:hypothetical protein
MRELPNSEKPLGPFTEWTGFLILAIALVSCSPAKPIDDAADFNTRYGNIGGVTEQVLTETAIANALSGSPTETATCSLVALLNQKMATFEPNLAAAPYWLINIGSIPHDGNMMTLTLGRRKFMNATELMRYQRDGNDYFAETVHYTIVPDSGDLHLASGIGYGPFTVRLIYINDPAVGHWDIDSSPYGQAPFDPEAERAAVLAQLAPAGCSSAPITMGIATARTHAFDQIEATLKNSGQIERGTRPDILVSRSGWHAFYTGYADGKKMEGTNWQTRLPTANALCQSISVGPYKNWRLPTPEEFQTATTSVQGSDSLRMFLDTPDRRLWGSVPPPEPNSETPFFLVKTTNPAQSGAFYFRADLTLAQTNLNWIGTGQARIICIADLDQAIFQRNAAGGVPIPGLNLQELSNAARQTHQQ